MHEVERPENLIFFSHSDTERNFKLLQIIMTVEKASRIGIFGVSGAGKSYLLDSIRSREDMVKQEGSALLFELDPEFAQSRQEDLRKHSIHQLTDEKKAVVLVGHYSFIKDNAYSIVHSPSDSEFFTHIIYLDFDVEIIHERRQNDPNRVRDPIEPLVLAHWIQQEKQGLTEVCRENGIVFICINESHTIAHVDQLLDRFLLTSNQNNLKAFQSIATESLNSPTIWLIDGDKTLSTTCTGSAFWGNSMAKIKAIFKDGYCYRTFMQLSLQYETFHDELYQEKCEIIAGNVVLFKEWPAILEHAQKKNVQVIVVTSGIKLIWEMVLDRYGLNWIPVVGGNRLSSDFLVDPSTKGYLAETIRGMSHSPFVISFGDSLVDLEMLRKAHFGFIIESGLPSTLDEIGQSQNNNLMKVILAGSRNPGSKFPVTTLKWVLDLKEGKDPLTLELFRNLECQPMAQVLSTKSRDSSLSSYELGQVHHEIGIFLSAIICNFIGCETTMIKHVQGHSVSGLKCLNEENICIVPLMRGGLPISEGIHSSFAFRKSFFVISVYN